MAQDNLWKLLSSNFYFFQFFTHGFMWFNQYEENQWNKHK